MAVADTPVNMLSLENPLFRAYLFYCAILVVKMMAMTLLTINERFKNQAFVNPEDVVGMKVKPKVDENVERVRRAHLNDLENITVFFFISFAYVMTNPALRSAMVLFRLYTGARILHTIVYAVYVIPQPARVISWFIGYGITGYMALITIVKCF